MQDILIYVRDFPEHTQAACYGVELAVALKASMTGVYVCPSPLRLAPAFEPELMSALVANTRKLVEEAVKERVPFLDWVASAGVAQSEWVVVEGDPVDAVARASCRHDLLVLDQAKGAHDLTWDIPGIIMKAGVPCIVVPRHGAHRRDVARVAIGWNASPEAMRAVHSALPLLRDTRVLLVQGEERERHPALEWTPPFRIDEYLRRRGMEVVSHKVSAGPDDIGAVLLEEAAQFDADLLVMGAYGRSRFSEWMLGGATRDVLAWAELPVLLRH